MSSEPARRLADLAALAAEQPAVRALLDRVGPDTSARLAEADPAFAVAFADYQTEYGSRALRLDSVDPTLRECPELIRDQIARAYDPAADALALGQDRAAAIAAPGPPRSRPATSRGSNGPWHALSVPTRCGRTPSSPRPKDHPHRTIPHLRRVSPRP